MNRQIPLIKLTPQKILIINVFGIGDVLFTTPLIRNLKKNFPGVFIGYIANKRTAILLKNNPLVDKVYIYERDDFRVVYGQSKLESVRYLRRALAEIRDEQFDLVIDLSMSTHVSFLMWWIGIKNRIGFNYKNRCPFLNAKVPFTGFEGKHVVDYYLELLEMLGVPVASRNLELPIPSVDRASARDRLKQAGITEHDLVVGIVPGGGASWGKEAIFKRWAAEKYAQLADQMIEKFSAKIILLGSEDERDLCSRVAQLMHHRVLQLGGETTILQMAAILDRCRLAVLNDGGPLHVAVAVGTQTVSLFGPVDERVYGPYPRGKHIVVKKHLACQPCYRRFRMAQCDHIRCLGSISVEEVYQKLEGILKEIVTDSHSLNEFLEKISRKVDFIQ
jgi:lipopolysaccharide heptosyltransferase II